MEARKLIKIKNSLFINIPMEIVEGLKLQRGDVLWVAHVPGYGIGVTKDKNSSKVSVRVAGGDRIKIVADDAYAELKRKAKMLERSFITNIMTRFIGEAVKSGLFDVESRVRELIERAEALGIEKRKIRGSVKSKKVTP